MPAAAQTSIKLERSEQAKPWILGARPRKARREIARESKPLPHDLKRPLAEQKRGGLTIDGGASRPNLSREGL
jgi:hypothetical protein